MIRFVTALPGGGKTYTALRFIIQELLNTNRWVVTNLTEIRVDKLQQYFHDVYPNAGIDLSKRLQIIQKVDSTQWYRFRGSYTLPEFDFKVDGRGKSTETPEQRDARHEAYFAEVGRHLEDKGCVYFLDEGHRHFKAETWADFAPLAMFYLSQLRHLNDVFWVLTQFPEQVIITLRRLAFDCHHLRNHYVESFLMWKKPGGFAWSQFNSVPKFDAVKSIEPMDSGRVTLDLKIASCYYTRGALGGKSDLAETKPATKKLPFWTLWAAVALACVVILFVFFQIPKAASWLTHKVVGGFVGSGQDATTAGVRALSGNSPVPKMAEKKQGASNSPVLVNKNVSPGINKDTPPAASSADKPLPTVEFWAVRGRSIRVGLSNGLVLTELDKTLVSVDASGVLMSDGSRLRYSRHVSRPSGAVLVREKVGQKSKT